MEPLSEASHLVANHFMPGIMSGMMLSMVMS